MHLVLGLFAATLASAALPVRVTPVTGESYQAQWEGVGPGGLKLRVGDQVQEVPLEQLQQVRRAEPSDATGPPTTVQLRDGSRLAVDSVTVQDDQATLALRRQSPLRVPVKQLHWIRFQAATAAVESQWQGIVQRDVTADTLIVRRDAQTLDRVGGIVQAVGPTEVQFDLEGQLLKAPIDRLEGILLAGTTEQASAPPVRIRGLDGSVWHAQELAAADDPALVSITTSGGLQYALPIERIEAIELASGIEYLAALAPVERSYHPFIAAPQSVAPQLDRWLGPAPRGDRDLLLRSKSVLTFRIDPGFRQFVATAEIDPSVEVGGEVQIRCLLDGRPAWEETLAVDGEARGVEMPLGDARRLTIEVDYGGDGDVGDVVWMREPRLIK